MATDLLEVKRVMSRQVSDSSKDQYANYQARFLTFVYKYNEKKETLLNPGFFAELSEV